MQVLCTTKAASWMPRPMSGQGRMVREAGKGKGSKEKRAGGGSFCPPSGSEQTQQEGEGEVKYIEILAAWKVWGGVVSFAILIGYACYVVAVIAKMQIKKKKAMRDRK